MWGEQKRGGGGGGGVGGGGGGGGKNSYFKVRGKMSKNGGGILITEGSIIPHPCPVS